MCARRAQIGVAGSMAILVSNFPTGAQLPEGIVRDEEPIIHVFFNEVYAFQGLRQSMSDFFTLQAQFCPSTQHNSL